MAPASLRHLVKTAAAAVDIVRRVPPGLVVLIYHRVGARTPVEVDLPLTMFAEQMSFLASRTNVVTLTDGLERVQSSTSGDPLVALTFDDGTADFVELALPVLVRHALPATIYVATRFVEDQSTFPDDGRPISWSGLRDAVATGVVDIGSHTHTHALLDRIAATEIDDELDRSIELIGERVGVQARHFAYPKAVEGSPAARSAVRSRFVSAAVAGTRSNAYGATDPYRIARSPIQASDDGRWFEKKVGGGMALEDGLRRVLNRRRYADTTT